MSKAMVYLETSFFRYLIARPSADGTKLVRQKLTQDWWQDHRHKYNVYISNTVYIEFCKMAAGKIPEQEAAKRLALLQNAESLPIESAIIELAASSVYAQGPLPLKADLESLHWAVAAYYGCDFVLTWNFTHLNNAAIQRRAERIIRDYSYEEPTLCSPLCFHEELEGIDTGGNDA